MADNNQQIINLAALNVDDRADILNVLKGLTLESDVLETLSPVVRKRVEALQEIQDQHDELEEKYFEERAALEAKYQKLYQPLYTKRFEIVTGATEVEGVEKETAADAAKEKGVPSFWLNALKNNDVVVEEIAEQDEDALKFLIDIKWSKVEEPKGFKLEFFFNTNPYFSNSVLTKTYHMVDEDEPILERATGTKIDWLPGKCLTENIMNKKQKKGSEDAEPITKTETCESFFNFFNPPEVPEDSALIDDAMAEKLQNEMEQDYDVGSTIRDEIIPHAVSWFTGEAADDFDDDEDDDDEYEEDEDEDDEEDEKEIKKKTEIAQLGAGGENPSDCKQQ